MLNETAITTVLTRSDEEIRQCGSNPPHLNRRSDWIGLDWKVCRGLLHVSLNTNPSVPQLPLPTPLHKFMLEALLAGHAVFCA
jgi:hypothetical protein